MFLLPADPVGREDLVHLVRDPRRIDEVDDAAERGPRWLADLAAWRRQVVLLPFDEAVAVAWGQVQARARLRGRPRRVNDSWIAACCLVNQLPLATFYTKDFADFAQHDGLVLLDVS